MTSAATSRSRTAAKLRPKRDLTKLRAPKAMTRKMTRQAT